MAALEATIHVRGPKGERSDSDRRLSSAARGHAAARNRARTGRSDHHVTLPPPRPGSRSLYLKLRDRASYEFALASAAVVITVANGKITRARVALGGVGTKPWRSPEAEARLTDQPATTARFPKSGGAALRDAKPQSQNGFKVELAKRCLVHALETGDARLPNE